MHRLSVKPSRLQLWGGTDSTVNRVGDRYIDQIALTGHDRRIEDLDLFADLGVSALRYPVLWERVAPAGIENADWSWADRRLERVRELGIEPIVGLVHHGSGPPHTSLQDPSFAEGLAAFARAVAERYPWITHYTPVNEPLTTARFSGLYGHWYPHGRDDATFVRMVLTQCRAVVLAMDAIRAVRPDAILVQTDDLGTTFSTPALRYQADHENHRHWLAFDLLAGRVGPDHPLWEFLMKAGTQPADLAWFRDHPCLPDIVGINHYLSSDRYLDEHLERYPGETPGGNGQDRYVDVLAARVRAEGHAGAAPLLRTAWERYRRPIAITEAHNGCTREEQMRWFLEVWNTANRARDEGIDVRAVTAWSLLGVYGWDQLVTDNGSYEPGVFDVRSSPPRATAMVPLLRSLARGETLVHPLLDVPGWWHRDVRFEHRFALHDDGRVDDVDPDRPAMRAALARPLLITGTGTLGRATARLCELRGIPYCLLGRREMDIAIPGTVRAVMEKVRPWAVVNTAGYVRVDDAEGDAERCFRENTLGAGILAAAAADRNIPFVTFSSDLVFDGHKGSPYVESDRPAPVSVYGASKRAAEEEVLSIHPSALVIRTSAFFGPWDEYNFVTIALRTLAAGETFAAAADQIVSPTYVPDLVNATLDLLIDGETGIRHLANDGAVSWADLAAIAAQRAGVPAAGIRAVPAAQMGQPAMKPRYSALGTERGQILRPLSEALNAWIETTAGASRAEEPVTRGDDAIRITSAG
ncbi:MAG TPA: family 1 glycosylhydrolase [Chloroflexota bacterium]|nr:family 1 glycosylhydrolase [Chloroflexota bacterium]